VSVVNKITKVTEHKIIGNIIAIWKKIKPSKTYWTIAIPLGLGIFSQAKSWKIAGILASYAEKQVKGSEYPWLWEILSAIASEFNDEANCSVVAVGLVVLLIVTYAFGKESSAKEQTEVLEKAIDNTKTNNYFVQELTRKNEEIESLREKLNGISEDERLALSYEIERLTQEKEAWEEKAKVLQERLNESDIEIVKEVEEILNTQGIDEVLAYLESIDFDHHEEKNREYAKALLIQADLYNMKNEHQKAKEHYEKSIRFYRTFSNSLDFVNYLFQQNMHKEAIRELKIMKLELDLTENEKIMLLVSLGNSYAKQNRLKKSEEVYNEALGLYRALAQNNPSAYNPNVATTLNNLAVLYSARNELKKAEEAYNEALVLRRALVQNNLSAYNPDMAMTLNNLANLYSDRKELDKAEEMYNEALTLYKALAQNNPSAYNPYVAMTLNNLAVLYQDRNELNKAEEVYYEALGLYRALAKKNPSDYNPNVAMTLNNLVILYRAKNELDKAEEAYNEALALYRALSQNNLSTYGIDLARIIIVGVYSVGLAKENLDEAEEILKVFEGVYEAEKLLENIKELRG